MKYSSQLHPSSHYYKTILGRLEYSLTRYKFSEKELLVANYHGTPRPFLENFEKQLDLFGNHFTFLAPDELEKFYGGTLDKQGPYLLLTFDDGLKNNQYAVDILDKRDIKAVHFVVPEFIEAKDPKSYYLEHVRTDVNLNISRDEDDFIPLSWQQLREMESNGHRVGSHSSSHGLTANCRKERSISEIAGSRKRIAAGMGCSEDKIQFFCSPNNSALSVGKQEMDLIQAHYNYHFTTFPGGNYSDSSPLLILRSNIEIYWTLGAVIQSLGKWDRVRWKKKIRSFRRGCLLQ